MSENIGWSKKRAEDFAKSCNTSEVDAYAQKEEHWPTSSNHFADTYQWIVVLQKKPKRERCESLHLNI